MLRTTLELKRETRLWVVVKNLMSARKLLI